MFLAVLQRYVDTTLAAVIQAASARGGDLVGSLTRSTSLDLLLIAALERGPMDADVAGLVRQALAMLEPLTTGRPDQHVPSTLVVSPTSALLGARLQARLYTDQYQGQGT